MRPPDPTRTIGLGKLLGWLVAIACIVVATVGLQLSQPGLDFQTVAGVRDEPVAFQDGTVEVGAVRVGAGLDDGLSLDRTPGMFVVVTLTLAAGGPSTLTVNDLSLLSGDRLYKPYEVASLRSAPGFAQTADIAFEVDPARIDGLTMQLMYSEPLHGLHERVRVPLGITAGNAGAWRVASAGQLIQPGKTVDRALP